MGNDTNDRRQYARYDLRLPVHYRVAEKGQMPRIGSGTTIDMSTSGIAFRCRRALPQGAHIELSVEWPSNIAAKQLVDLQITGFVVRSDNGKTGVRVTSHKFKTVPVAMPMRATA